jgi:hypothetical protein
MSLLRARYSELPKSLFPTTVIPTNSTIHTTAACKEDFCPHEKAPVFDESPLGQSEEIGLHGPGSPQRRGSLSFSSGLGT